MTIGVFALLSAVGNKRPDSGRRSEGASRLGMVMPLPCTQLDDLRGLSRSQPSVALLLAICLFSLTGLPPTAGFLGKLNLFFAAWFDDSQIGRGLAIALAINAAISAWYYLRMVALMFLEPADAEAVQARRTVWLPWFAGAACALATIVIFVAPQWLWDSVR
jgi:NADH-quinone oxidoreductase subunit N